MRYIKKVSEERPHLVELTNKEFQNLKDKDEIVVVVSFIGDNGGRYHVVLLSDDELRLLCPPGNHKK